jgi:AbrB family looped-hinge helix DNA binding protein
MKKFPKILQCDKRGQIVIPKDIRRELGIDEGTGFWLYTITDEGILLKKISMPELSSNRAIIEELKSKADKIDVKEENIDKSIEDYKKTKEGNLDLI